jgi:hypothetical protein
LLLFQFLHTSTDMSTRELILLSPYRLPGQNSLSLGDDDAASFLNAWSALWHPALLAGAGGPPKTASAYDHEQPSAGQVYALPESPPLLLPDDWDQRVRDAGALAFRAGPDRGKALENLKEALRNWQSATSTADQPPSNENAEAAAASPPPDYSTALLDLGPDQIAPFFGIGLGFLLVNSLFEAMEHENLLAAADLWQDVLLATEAITKGDAEASRQQLQAAAERLLSAREILYPSPIHVIDVSVLDEARLSEPLPLAFERELPINLVASAALLEKLAKEQPERLALLRERLQQDKLEVCSGPYLEREDALLPVESQLWNLLKGSRVFQELLGSEPRVYGRKRFAAHPQLPMLLHGAGVNKALLLSLDNGVLPNWRSVAIGWPSPDGKQVDTFARTPHPADSPQTFFNLAHHLYKTIREDTVATLAVLHRDKPANPWYRDWVELTRFAPVLGAWFPLSRFFSEAMASEYTSAPNADDFHSDYLEERTNAKEQQPVGWFARRVRQRRALDTAWTLAGIFRGLTGAADQLKLDDRLTQLEDQLETTGSAEAEQQLGEVQQQIVQALGGRLVSRAKENRPGWLVLNPCSFTRRVALELEGITTPLPIDGPVKACQIDADAARLVVEVPQFGFAWFPHGGPAGTPPMKEKIKLADQRGVRNEFFDAEVDPRTGGLAGVRDHRQRVNRLGQILVFNPGSRMRADEVKVTVAGPALGEVVSSGTIRGEQDQLLARFRQRFRAWLGRPVLELRVELTLEQPPAGYPWHAYFAARFNWGDERVVLMRGVNATNYVTSHTRPETPDFLELRLGPQRTAIFPGGLPFHQRQGTRMLDTILVPEGEQTQAFEIGVGLDRDYLMHTALGTTTPIPLLKTDKGPPHIGASGWLFHLDATNLLLTSMRPAPGGADAVTLRLLECNNHSGAAELRCTRNPKQASLVDARGNSLLDAAINGDAVSFEVSGGDIAHLRVGFSE